MAISVVMPALEMAQETGKLISWLKKEGDSVKKGEMLLEIETDKAVMEIESPGDGILAAVSAQPGSEVPVGQTIAWIVNPGEAPPALSSPTQTGRHIESTVQSAAEANVEAPAESSSHGIRVSPKARRLAKEKGIDLAKVHGSGTEGEILADDILKAAGSSAAPAGSSAATNIPTEATASRLMLGPIAKLMATRTTQSWTTVPHFFVSRELDGTELKLTRQSALAEVERTDSAKVTLTDFLVLQVARALARHPRVNASWIGETIQLNAGIHVALAMAVEDGVVAAVIHDADKLAIGKIAKRRYELAERARANKLRPEDISRGTFTISNLGMFNVDAFQAIITPPQAAILAVGRIVDRVVAVDGQAAIRPMMNLTLSCDHRVMDGAMAARFLDDLARGLEGAEGTSSGPRLH